MTELHRKPFRAGRLGAAAAALLISLLPATAAASSPEVEGEMQLDRTGRRPAPRFTREPSAPRNTGGGWRVPSSGAREDDNGWRGPWGTTYPSNLRLFMAKLSEKEWVTLAKHLETRPPMPWFTLQRMTDGDLRAIYKFVRSLGPAGSPAPAYLPPDKAPPQPYIQVP